MKLDGCWKVLKIEEAWSSRKEKKIYMYILNETKLAVKLKIKKYEEEETQIYNNEE